MISEVGFQLRFFGSAGVTITWAWTSSSTRAVQIHDEELFLLHGIDANAYALIAIKGVNHLRAAYRRLEAQINAMDSVAPSSSIPERAGSRNILGNQASVFLRVAHIADKEPRGPRSLNRVRRQLGLFRRYDVAEAIPEGIQALVDRSWRFKTERDGHGHRAIVLNPLVRVRHAFAALDDAHAFARDVRRMIIFLCRRLLPSTGRRRGRCYRRLAAR
ncbi:MlrC C-terminal domain-containing protein [Achromobacter sp. Marseille-Q0513]|nr:MlrC C-terminal domain-containing protein [Achromobacter sp. Marseille-Q0513]